MSNVLAIAAVTQLLKDQLNDTLINGDVSRALGADFTVTALPPNRVVADSASDQATQLNLFLYRVSPNAALRNSDLPTRNRAGEKTTRPRLAIDLHYIVTAVSAEELHAEILLGYAMQLFHETAILPRELIRNALNIAAIGEILPEAFDPIRASELADQIELIKITPRTLTMDDMSKLWTAFQASYRTTVAYDVSVVLIERELSTRPSLPVLSRGGLIDPVSLRDPGVSVRPDLLISVPTLTSVVPADKHPVMRLGGTVILEGFALVGGEVSIRFREPGTQNFLEMAPLTPTTTNRLLVDLPDAAALASGSSLTGSVNDPTSWRIGTYTVDVRILSDDGRVSYTNAFPIALAPRSTSSAVSAGTQTTITLTSSPPIRPNQSVEILAGQQSQPVTSPVISVTSVQANFSGLTTGPLPVRLRVDGIDSPVINRSTTPPSLETVLIP